jgi:hypothetical protein
VIWETSLAWFISEVRTEIKSKNVQKSLRLQNPGEKSLTIDPKQISCILRYAEKFCLVKVHISYHPALNIRVNICTTDAKRSTWPAIQFNKEGNHAWPRNFIISNHFIQLSTKFALHSKFLPLPQAVSTITANITERWYGSEKVYCYNNVRYLM